MSSIQEIYLPLVQEEPKFTKANSIALKLRVDPGDDHSPTYEKTVPILTGQEGVSSAVNFSRVLETVYAGMHADTASKKRTVVELMLKDNAKAVFQATVDGAIEENFQQLRQAAFDNRNGTDRQNEAARDAVQRPAVRDEDVVRGVHGVVTHMCPLKVLSKVKRQMRRNMRKTVDTSIRQFFTNFRRINDEELKHLPPFADANSLADDEVTEIMLAAIPKSWVNKLIEQVEDYDTMNPNDLLQILEKFEATEEKPKAKENNGDKKSSNSSNKKSKTSNGNKGSNSQKSNNGSDQKKGTKWCMMHKWNTTHETNDCKTIKSKLEGNNNKTWSRKSEDAKKKAKDDMAAMMADTVKSVVQQELKAFGKTKKRKIVLDSDDEEEGELRNFEFGKLTLDDDVMSEATA
jgi:hypothetical protein